LKPVRVSRDTRFAALVAAVAAGIFALDLLLPRGSGAGMLYVFLVCLSLTAPRRRTAWPLAGIASMLVVVGFALSPPATSQSWPAPLSRALALGAVVLAAALCEAYQRAGLQRAWAAEAIDSSPEAHLSVDQEGVIRSWNPAAERLFGYPAGEAVGRHISLLVPPERSHEIPGVMRQWRQGRKIKSFETVRRHKSGRLLHVSCTIWPVANERGEIVGCSAGLVDLSDRKRLEEALTESREVLKAVTASSPDYILIFNREHKLLFANRLLPAPEAAKHSGLSILEAGPAAQTQRLREAFDRVLRTGEPEEFDASLRLHGADPLYFEGRIWPVRLQGRVSALAVSLSDVTERRKVEKERDRLFRLSKDLMCVLRFDGTMLRVNPAFEPVLGYRPGELEGRHFRPFIHPEDMPAANEHMQRVIRGDPTSTVEARSLAQDGSYRWISWTAAADPEQALVFAVGRDVSGERRTQQSLAQAARELESERNLLRTLIDAIPDAVYVKDAERRFLVANQTCARFAGVAGPEEFLGRTDENFFPPELAATLREREEEIVRTGKPFYNLEESVPGPNGEPRWFSTTKVPLRDERGRVTKIVGVTREITALKRSQEERSRIETQLRQAQRLEAIGVLAGGVAHDFNNILTAIWGYAALARDELPQASRERGHLDEVLKASERARDLVRQILAFSRRGEESRQRLQISTVIREDLKLFRATLPSSIELHEQIDPECGAVLADPTQIHQIVMNLCTNAYQALGQAGGAVKVALERVQVGQAAARANPYLNPGPYARLAVSDTGQGIDPKIADRIFEPFFTTKGLSQGTGLGLSVVHGIVTSYGGAINFDSVPGQGTTFSVHLPLAPAREELEEQAPSSEPLPRGGERILFVDDEEPLAQLGKEMLERLGYQVEAFSSSREALEAFRQDPQEFDLALTDLTMPGLTGVDLGREFLALRPDLPVILATGFSEQMDAPKAKELGFQAYVAKPFVLSDLARTLREALGREV